MKIWSYVMAFPDDRDVIMDALRSLEKFSDLIFVVDGGFEGALCHHPRYTEPLRPFLEDQNFQCPIALCENPFYDPGAQRNWLTKTMESFPDQPDWYVWIDADEVCSHQMEDGIRDFLSQQPSDVTNVVPKWLNLCQDERHIAGGNHSSWLAHGRAYRPGTVYWNAGWHEHQYYQGKRVQWDVRVVHTRALYRKRLLVQRGHPRVGGKDNPLWGDVESLEPVPAGVTWTPLHWPEGEEVLGFHEDARNYWSV